MNAQSIRLTAALVAALALVIGAIAVTDAGAGGASSAASVVLGKTAVYPSSGCPNPDKCEVVARVTGIQMKAEGTDHPFRSPITGKLVAWWLKLPRLHSTQVQ